MSSSVDVLVAQLGARRGTIEDFADSKHKKNRRFSVGRGGGSLTVFPDESQGDCVDNLEFLSALLGAVVDLELVALAELGLDVLYDTHGHLTVDAEGGSDTGTLGFGQFYFMLLEEEGDIVDAGDLVAELDAGRGTVDALVLLRGPADVNVVYEGLLIQLGKLGSFGRVDRQLEVRIPQYGYHHEEKEQHEDNIGQGGRRDSGRRLTALFAELSHGRSLNSYDAEE